MSIYKCLMHYNNINLYTNQNWNIRGVNLGGFMVLEPWITPSMFYQFTNPQIYSSDIGMDMYSFCKILKSTGYMQLEEHFENWITEEDIIDLKNREITHVRIPVADWIFIPYEPYIGCTDNSITHLNRVIKYCEKYDIKVLLDLHAVKDSQNGLDNSGKTSGLEYIVAPDYNYHGMLTFRHWSIRDAPWIGEYNHKTKNYTKINYDNIEFTKSVLYKIIDLYKDNPIIFGIEPLNEPWQFTPEKILKDFYYSIYEYMSMRAPHWKFIYHDSFRHDIWNDFLINCTNTALDWHVYQAWKTDRYGDLFLLEADANKNVLENYKKSGINVVIGEWSIATDNCAMWLNGFQDNLEGYPVTECKYTTCPNPYIVLARDIDRTSNIISPFGTGKSSPMMGACPYDGTLLVISEHEDKFLHEFTQRNLKSFQESQGWFFWNFKTEIKEEKKWNYIESYNKGYFTPNKSYSTREDTLIKIFSVIGCLCIIVIFYLIYKISKQSKYGIIYVKNPHFYEKIKYSQSHPGDFNNYQTIVTDKTHFDVESCDFKINIANK